MRVRVALFVSALAVAQVSWAQSIAVNGVAPPTGITVVSEEGFLKTGLHEIGHALGLAHPTATLLYPEGLPTDSNTIRGGTVMNPMGNSNEPGARPWELRDDFRRFVPLAPTACDITAVRNATQR